MNISQIQIGLDVATALSVIGAAYAFVRSNAKENKKDRDVRLREFNVQKLSEVIIFLNEKVHKSMTINEQISKTIGHPNLMPDRLFTQQSFFCQIWKNPVSTPQQYSIYKIIIELQDNVLFSTIKYLKYHPYINLLDKKVQKKIKRLIENFEDLCHASENNEMSLADTIHWMETEPNFPQFLMDKNIFNIPKTEIDERTSYKLENDEFLIAFTKKEEMVMSLFEKLNKEKQCEIKEEYLLNKLLNIDSFKDKWLLIPEKIENVIKVLSEESYTLIKS